MKRKKQTVFLLTAMLLLVLAGCSGNEDAKQKPEKDPVEKNDTVPVVPKDTVPEIEPIEPNDTIQKPEDITGDFVDEIFPDSEVKIIEKNIDGIVFKFCLLNEE
jgi:PBP1b-binding outer membrane lipoprotein LpoB